MKYMYQELKECQFKYNIFHFFFFFFWKYKVGLEKSPIWQSRSSICRFYLLGKGPSNSSSTKIINYNEEQGVALGRKNVRAACPKDKLEFMFFFPRALLGHSKYHFFHPAYNETNRISVHINYYFPYLVTLINFNGRLAV